MKQSRFTSIIPLESNPELNIMHNTLSNALVVLDRESMNKIDKLMIGDEITLDKEFILELQKKDFFVENDMDEMAKFDLQRGGAKYGKSSIGITIAPTLDCNFGCPYCYEAGNNKPGKMSEDVQNKVIEYFASVAANKVAITWYGGEPLLALDTIESFTEKMYKYCEGSGTDFEADIITNAYFLTDEVVEKFERLRITKLQITVDGPREIHDSRRFLIGGGNTFDIILENLKRVAGRYEIHLRVNVDKSNEDKVLDLLDDLAEIDVLDKIHAYLGHVTSPDSFFADNCLSLSEFAMMERKWFDKAQSLSKINKYNQFYRLPTILGNRCISDTQHGYVIDPDGYLYKCWNHIGNVPASVGNIKEPILYNKYLVDYAMAEDFRDNQCSKCIILPYCFGGCVDDYVRFKKHRCHPLKYYYKDYLQSLVNEMMGN